MGKREIARNEQFLLYLQCFLLKQIIVSPFVHMFDIISLFAAELKEPKIGISGKGLIAIHYVLKSSGDVIQCRKVIGFLELSIVIVKLSKVLHMSSIVECSTLFSTLFWWLLWSFWFTSRPHNFLSNPL